MNSFLTNPGVYEVLLGLTPHVEADHGPETLPRLSEGNVSYCQYLVNPKEGFMRALNWSP